MSNPIPASLYPWLHDSWLDLQKRHRQQGLPHALMLTGPRGMGKHVLSLEIARWLLCTRRIPQQLGSACGECHSCQLWQAGNHPDFLECKPEDGSKQIRIDGVRRVNEFLVQTPQISPCQVVILAPVEVLNVNAANALLKTLEEPPGESFILLETERHGSVMPTIRSRCQRLSLAPPPLAVSLAWLQQQGLTETDARQSLKSNQLAPVAALEWVKQDYHSKHQNWLTSLQRWSSKQASLEDTLAQWRNDELVDVIEWLGKMLADLMKARMGAQPQQIIESGVLQCFEPSTLDVSKLLALHERISSVAGQLRSGVSHHNRQLLLESLLIEWRGLAVTMGRI
ncbi:DNA polymerase III subunit delta' [Oceanobacter mangrovi]|uniref:DNA polymerase III subunit delta' n=1 Tax=Oceanobacter mangrovi TaxID=2862510 RepID=UPI001C8EC4C1|nr:DNA polymerase III subunit delta' [Oceanobacter mangrovi]